MIRFAALPVDSVFDILHSKASTQQQDFQAAQMQKHLLSQSQAVLESLIGNSLLPEMDYPNRQVPEVQLPRCYK